MKGAVGPVSVNGRLFVQGQFSVLAYDAYNGMFLWEHKNPGAFRTGVFQNFNPSNLVASKDRVFVLNGPYVAELDAANGKLIRKHELPEEKRKDREWTYIAHQDGILFGTSSVRKELPGSIQTTRPKIRRRHGRHVCHQCENRQAYLDFCRQKHFPSHHRSGTEARVLRRQRII